MWENPPPREKHEEFMIIVKRVTSDQSFARNLEEASKLPSLKNYIENKQTFGGESYILLSLKLRRPVAIFRMNCTRSLPIKHTSDYKQCELCESKVQNVWCHMLYFCNKLTETAVELPSYKILDHLFHYQKNTNKYNKRLFSAVNAKNKALR